MNNLATTVSRVANETYSHTRRIMPERPWWYHLESSLHKFPDDFELDLRTELTVDSTAVGDYMLRTVGASLLAYLALPGSLAPNRQSRSYEPATGSPSQKSNTSIREVPHMLAVHSPLTYTPPLSKDRLIVITGAGDRLAPPKHARLLWDHWDRPDIHRFPGNHIVHLDQGKYLKEMSAFLRDLRFDRH